MSKELELIAHALAHAADDGCFDNPPTFDDDGLPDLDVDLDEWHSGGEDRVHWMKLARASVSKLSEHGYSIVQLPEPTGRDDVTAEWDEGAVRARLGSRKVRVYLDDARLAVGDARELAGQLLAAAAAAEEDTNG